MTFGTDPDRVALDHAMEWFKLHAGQRMQLLNFFFLSVALLATAYVSALDAGLPGVAFVVAVAGVLSVVAFIGLEQRTRDLVKAAEASLARSQARLAGNLSLDEIRLVARVEHPQRWPRCSYADSIGFLLLVVGTAFTIGAIHAVRVHTASTEAEPTAIASWVTVDITPHADSTIPMPPTATC